MAGIIRSGSVEYVVETTHGTFPTNPTMLWIGGGVSLTGVLPGIEFEDYKILKDFDDPDKIQIESSIKLGENLSAELEYLLQNWTFLKYAFSSVGGGTTTDALATISLGLKSADAKYAKLSGYIIERAEVTIPNRGIARATIGFLGANLAKTANNPWSATDYVGTGSHASRDTGAPLKWEDIDLFTYGGTSISNTDLRDVTFGITNTIEPSYDALSTLSTRIASWAVTDRRFSFRATIAKEAIDAIATAAGAFSAGDLVLSVGTTNITFSNARIAIDPLDFAIDGLLTVDVEFVGITDIAFS